MPDKAPLERLGKRDIRRTGWKSDARRCPVHGDLLEFCFDETDYDSWPPLELQKKMGALQAFPALRNRVPSGAHEAKEEEEVRLLSGEISRYPTSACERAEVPDYMHYQIFGLPGAAVAVEFVVSRDGVPRLSKHLAF